MKVLPGFGRRNKFSSGKLTGDLKWGKPSPAPSAPSSLRGPSKPPIRLVMFRSREGVFQPISGNRGVIYCQNEDGLLQPRARTDR